MLHRGTSEIRPSPLIIPERLVMKIYHQPLTLSCGPGRHRCEKILDTVKRTTATEKKIAKQL